ncbi:hypothetical protein SO802_007564 [Lithocarpus litseifolius]|uniref:Reverse transcriptase zinc-binding domain-containing protein n=1 Tax=Lithocarpus litseifolius TaxID=425828 RepID=A0AAW2DUN4_9ROSI
MRDNILLFKFEDYLNLDHVLELEPWSYDKHLVVFQRTLVSEAAPSLDYSRSSFWIQLHNVPAHLLTTETGDSVGRTLGRVLQVTDPEDDGAKQVWWMMNNPDSLCHRVFKAIFFRNCSILEARDSIVGSYAWKSILSAKDVIRRGMVWRVGTGERDHIRWNEEVVRNLFLPHEAESILAIPLSLRRPSDRIAWKHTPSGMFTTSSAYKLIVSRDYMPNAGSSSVENKKKFWKSLWQLRVPNKIKHFVWKACNEALPTKTNLHHRHVADSDICDLCGELPEDTVHALWSCKHIACVWSSLEWFHQSVPVQPVNFRELLARFMPSQDEYKAEIFAIAGWCVWNRRNAIHFNRAIRPVDSICKEADNILQEFLHAWEVELSHP